MTQTVHLVRADARRFRLLIAAWVLIQAADAAMRGLRPTLGLDQRLALPLELLGAVLFAVRWLGAIAIVPLIVQTHPLVGSDAFWMTRPIPWRLLFNSKLLLLGTVLVAVPAVCEASLMLAVRVPFADAFPVLLQTVLLQSLLLFSLMTLAVMTPNLARFVLAMVGVLVGAFLLINLVFVALVRNLPEGPQLSPVGPRAVESSSPFVTVLVLLAVAAIALVIVQYRTRSRPRAVATGVAGVVVTVLVADFWPWGLQTLPPPEWTQSASSLQMISETPVGEFRTYDSAFLAENSGWRSGGIRVRMRGVEPGWLTTARLSEASIELDDGRRLTTAGNGFDSRVRFEGLKDLPLDVVLRHVLAVDRAVGSTSARYAPEAIQGIAVTEAAFREHSGRTGTYRGRYLVDLERLSIASVLPLEAGATYRDRGFRLVIERVVPNERTVSVRVRQIAARTFFDGDRFPRLSFYLRNGVRSEAVPGSTQPWGGEFRAVSLPLFLAGGGGHSSLESPDGGFSVTSSVLQFPEIDPAGSPVIDVDAAWLSGAEFVIVRTEISGSVVRTLEIPGFRIEAAAAPTSGVRR